MQVKMRIGTNLIADAIIEISGNKEKSRNWWPPSKIVLRIKAGKSVKMDEHTFLAGVGDTRGEDLYKHVAKSGKTWSKWHFLLDEYTVIDNASNMEYLV